MDHVDKILKQWQQERPDLDVRAMELIGRLKKINLHLSREMEKTWTEFDLTPASFDVLATLRRAGPPYGLSPGELIDSTMVTSGTMTNRINQLEKAELVERVQNQEDRRGFLISLSDKGFKLIDDAVTAHTKTQKRLVSGLSEDDFQALNGLLRTYLADFE